MIKLIRSAVRRYSRSISFWLAAAATLINSLTEWVTGMADIRRHVVQVIIFMLLISWQTGTIHSSGMLKNRVIAGHSKKNLYLSEFITGMGACALLLAVRMGIYWFRHLYYFVPVPDSIKLVAFLELFGATMCFAAIFMAVGIFIPSGYISGTVNAVIVLVLYASAGYAYTSHVKPECSDIYYTRFTADDGSTYWADEIHEKVIREYEYTVYTDKFGREIRRPAEVNYDNGSANLSIPDAVYVINPYSWLDNGIEMLNTQQNIIQENQIWNQRTAGGVTAGFAAEFLILAAAGCIAFRKKQLM